MKTKLFLLILLASHISFAQKIYKSSIDNGGASVGNSGIHLVYSIGEVHVRELTVNNIGFSEGFIGPRFYTASCLSIHFTAGWNIFSSPNYPDPGDVFQIFQPFLNRTSLVKIQDESGQAFENLGIYGGWQNYIGDLTPDEGYKIKLSTEDSLEICGTPVSYPFPIPLKAGWNIMGYPQTASYDGIEVLQQLIDKGTLLKVQDESGNSIEDWGSYGGWQNNVRSFTPGEGYKIKTNSDDTLWIYKAYAKSEIIQHEILQTTHFTREFKGNGVDHMNLNFVGLPSEILEAGDELAVFDGDVCVGATVLVQYHLDRQAIPVIASATDKDGTSGFHEGKVYQLKLWKAKMDREYVLEPKLIKGPGTFTKHATAMLSLKNLRITDAPERIAEPGIRCYPNPFDSEITIEINIPEQTQVKVEVLNQLGQSVKFLETGNLMNRGVYRINWNGEGENNRTMAPGIYHLKVEVGDKVLHRKIIMSN
ncbi:MAG: T9SS type A sorting domain-containing protein [Draconibacterium sp.]